MKELKHIIGTRQPYTLRLTEGGVPMVFSSSNTVRFKGLADQRRPVDINLTPLIVPGASGLEVWLSNLVNELTDKVVRGRFHIGLASGVIKPSQALMIKLEI